MWQFDGALLYLIISCPVIIACDLANLAQYILKGLGGAVEVDEAEDYEVPGSNPGQELWNMKMCFSMRKAISNIMLVTWYQIGVVAKPNVGLRMLLVVGAGGGTSQARRDVNGSAT
jgi:hypothetical protein